MSVTGWRFGEKNPCRSIKKIAAEIARKFGIDCMELTEEVFESALPIVCEAAENQIRTTKALLAATFGT